MPAVSVLVPIYNSAKYLTICLDSLVAQTFDDIEVICIDDGSTDDSGAIIDRYVDEQPNFRVIHKPNSGYGDSMNLGIQAAAGKWIGLVEPDDFASALMFETLHTAVEAAGADMIKGDYFQYREFARFLHELPQHIFAGHTYAKPFRPADDPSVIRVKPSIWTGLYRRSMIEDEGIAFNTTPGASFQDTGFLQKCWIVARTAVLWKKPFLYYRVDNDASSVFSTSKVYELCTEYESTFEFLDARGPQTRAVFAPMLNAQRNDGYIWNYQRIAPELRPEFARRWGADLLAAHAAGELDFDLLDFRDRQLAKTVMLDPELFVKQYPDA